MLARWLATVLGLIWSRLAISPLDTPVTGTDRTSHSRRVSLALRASADAQWGGSAVPCASRYLGPAASRSHAGGSAEWARSPARLTVSVIETLPTLGVLEFVMCSVLRLSPSPELRAVFSLVTALARSR